MRIDYHDLSEKDFDRQVVTICAEILGAGILPCCGGEDECWEVRLDNTATQQQDFAVPNKDQFVVQSNYTELLNSSFSESEVPEDCEKSTLTRGIERVKALRKKGELEYDMLFSKRFLCE